MAKIEYWEKIFTNKWKFIFNLGLETSLFFRFSWLFVPVMVRAKPISLKRNKQNNAKSMTVNSELKVNKQCKKENHVNQKSCYAQHGNPQIILVNQQCVRDDRQQKMIVQQCCVSAAKAANCTVCCFFYSSKQHPFLVAV